MNSNTSPDKNALYHVDGVHGLFADAAAWDGATGELFFISLWGRDTAMQELMARLSLPPEQGGFSTITLTDAGGGRAAQAKVADPGALSRLSGRTPASGLFGELAHVWVYTPLAQGPDRAARRALRLVAAGGGREGIDPEAVWPLFKEVSHLPLLDEWRDEMVGEAAGRGWIKRHDGIAVAALEIDLGGADYEAVVGDMIRQGRLRLPGEATPPSGGDGRGGPPPGVKTRMTAEQLEWHLRGFTGTGHWYRHWLAREMLYTDGVEAFAEHGGQQGAYWFLDVAATEFFPLLGEQPFMHIVLSVKDRQATLTVDDGNGRILREKRVEYTDMQEGDWRFYLTDNVLLLPGEY